MYVDCKKFQHNMNERGNAFSGHLLLLQLYESVCFVIDH